jgi:hypothetical protein
VKGNWWTLDTGQWASAAPTSSDDVKFDGKAQTYCEIPSGETDDCNSIKTTSDLNISGSPLRIDGGGTLHVHGGTSDIRDNGSNPAPILLGYGPSPGAGGRLFFDGGTVTIEGQIAGTMGDKSYSHPELDLYGNGIITVQNTSGSGTPDPFIGADINVGWDPITGGIGDSSVFNVKTTYSGIVADSYPNAQIVNNTGDTFEFTGLADVNNHYCGIGRTGGNPSAFTNWGTLDVDGTCFGNEYIRLAASLTNKGGSAMVEANNHFQIDYAGDISGGTFYQYSLSQTKWQRGLTVDSGGTYDIGSSDTETISIASGYTFNMNGTLNLGAFGGDYPTLVVDAPTSITGTVDTYCNGQMNGQCGTLKVTSSAAKAVNIVGATINVTGDNNLSSTNNAYNVLTAPNTTVTGDFTWNFLGTFQNINAQHQKINSNTLQVYF